MCASRSVSEMPIAHYPYTPTGVHPGFYNSDCCPGPPADALSRRPQPSLHTGPSYTGSHSWCSPAGGPGSDGGHMSGASHGSAPHPGYHGAGDPVAAAHNSGQIPSPDNGVPLPRPHVGGPVPYSNSGDTGEPGTHNGDQVARAHNMGPYPGPSGRGLEPQGQLGRLVSGGYPTAGVLSNDGRHMMYPPLAMMDHRGLPYPDPRRHSYAAMQQYPSFAAATMEAGPAAYEQAMYRPPAAMQLCQVYPDCRVNGNYGSYIQQPVRGGGGEQQQQQPQVSPECGHPQVGQNSLPVTTKVEPDAEQWSDGDLLERVEQVPPQTEEAPTLVCREYTKPRRRRRNSEKRKEKSRDAARCRRGKESEIFTELASALPLPPQTISQLDKASVMRLTLAFLKTRALCHAGFSKCVEGGSTKLDVEKNELFLKALDGFVLVLSIEGDIVYTSENIVNFLGLPQVDVMGQSLYDYTHPCDHEEVRELMTNKGPQEPRHAFLRLKCTLTAKGRSVNLKSASYKVVQVSGELVGREEEQSWLVALGTPVPHPSNIEFPLDKQTFVSKHSLDMKFTYVDDNVGDFCGYSAEELVGHSLYEMHHALDSDLVKDAYKTLRNKGQVETGRYRFLARDGGYVWLVTQATLIHGPKDHKPQYVVCLNYVVSGVESSGEILSELQLICSTNSPASSKVSSKSSSVTVAAPPVVKSIATPKVPLAKSSNQPKVEEVTSSVGVRLPSAPPPRPPVAATSKVFAPRTEDMNKGYLMFPNGDPQCTVLKEEPEDLTHLAPSGGDTCVPLLDVPTLIHDLNEDTCIPQDVSKFIPNLDEIFTLDYPITSSDVLISSPVPDNTEEQENSQDYFYDENKLKDGVKCMNSLSGGKIVINKSGCNASPSYCSTVRPSGQGTPEPPKPLLSQAALPSVRERKQNTFAFGSSRPRTTTESLFMQLDESRTTGSTAEVFGKLDLKLDQNMDTDDLEYRAPFIPLSNEVLMLSPDDLLWGAESEPVLSPKHHASSSRYEKCSNVIDKEDSSLAQLLRDTDPPITGIGPGRNLRPENSTSTQGTQYQQSKFLDGGGNFVDPNKVLPGHSGGKEDLDCTSASALLVDPPPVMVQETVEPPPPLLTHDSHPVSLPVKRVHSPNSSPILNHKKLCSPSCQLQQKHNSQVQDGLMQQPTSGVRLLATPYAPTMQQLLVSKEPITVRGGRPGGGIGVVRSSVADKGHSVLRNLLDVHSDGSLVIGEPQPGGSGLTSTSVYLPRDKVTPKLLTGCGGKIAEGHLPYPKLRLVTGSQNALMQAGHLAFKLASNPNGLSGEGSVKLTRRQDPLLLMDPDTTIPNLLDLTQLDYEVNAPANNNNLLHGPELVMALDQGL